MDGAGAVHLEKDPNLRERTMWIEATPGVKNITRRERGDDGRVKAEHSADFNHNGRADVEKRTGDFLLKAVPALKAVKDGGPPPPKVDEEEASEAAVEQEKDSDA